MNANNRNLLNHRIRDFFITELKKEFKDDFSLIEKRIDQLIPLHSIKDVRYILRQEVNKLKHGN
jgi:hypothetical protein